jgi:hypothetical protein
MTRYIDAFNLQGPEMAAGASYLVTNSKTRPIASKVNAVD